MRRYLFIAFLLLPLFVTAQNKKVALLQTLNGDKSIQVKGIEMNMVRGELRKAISNQAGFQAFTRTDIDQLMKEHGFQGSGMVSDAQRKRLGEMSGADYICVSTLTKSNTQFYLEAYLIEVETGEISNPASQFGVLQGNTYANLFQLCQDLAKELISDVGGLSNTDAPAREPTDQGSVEGPTKASEQHELAGDYYYGRNGKTKDYSQAVYWLRKAAEQGYADAQCNLGFCYGKGNGVPQSWSDAVYWYRKAAEQSNARAQYNLGLYYEKGWGVSQSWGDAVYWYRKAAEQGYADAQCNLGFCYNQGNGVSQNQSDAVYWYRKAAEQGNARAQCNLGICYGLGEGVSQNWSDAVYWYRKAAEQGNAPAQYGLGICYETGNGVSQSRNDAVYWYRKAAEQGMEQAISALNRLTK